jgi:hypothetical protein
MPNLENLKKQAKQYLRWHRERYHPVAAEIRAALPRFRHLDDHQVLEASFKLSDAQELVARQLGFEGWQALKAGTQAMSSQVNQATKVPILSGTQAILYVADFKASCDFFTSKLGFAIDFAYGDPPFYGRSNATMRGFACGLFASQSLSASTFCRPRSQSTQQRRSSNSSWSSSPQA